MHLHFTQWLYCTDMHYNDYRKSQTLPFFLTLSAFSDCVTLRLSHMSRKNDESTAVITQRHADLPLRFHKNFPKHYNFWLHSILKIIVTWMLQFRYSETFSTDNIQYVSCLHIHCLVAVIQPVWDEKNTCLYWTAKWRCHNYQAIKDLRTLDSVVHQKARLVVMF